MYAWLRLFSVQIIAAMRYMDGSYDLSLVGWWIEVLASMVYSSGVSLAVVSRIDGKLASIPE